MRKPRRLLLLLLMGMPVCPAVMGLLTPSVPPVFGPSPAGAPVTVRPSATMTRVCSSALSLSPAAGTGTHVFGGHRRARCGGNCFSPVVGGSGKAVVEPMRSRGSIAVAATSDGDCVDEEATDGGEEGRFVEQADDSPKRRRDETSHLSRRRSRRDVLRTTASSIAAMATASACSSPDRVEALPLPFNLGNIGGAGGKPGRYVPAKRATAYLVDSTIPPTLIPLRAAREAAVLKNLGNGLGTPKTPVLDESINLNNFMKKGITGALDAAGLGDESKKRKTGLGAASFVFLGVNDPADPADGELAASILTDVVKPRSRADTAVGLASVAGSAQSVLDSYLSSGDEGALIGDLSTGTAELSTSEADALLPVLRFARSKRLPLLALGPEMDDVRTVRSKGLQSVDLDRRARYVADTEGFINLTQDPRFKLYTDRSMLKDFRPKSDGDDPADFFAERILSDEAVATAASRWAILRPDSMVVVLCGVERARFMGGANGRVPRVCKFLSPDSTVDEESVTTILLNPTAEKTLSLSKFLRLEIGTSPETLDYQTKVADYLWFSTMPKVNMLPRMMNY